MIAFSIYCCEYNVAIENNEVESWKEKHSKSPNKLFGYYSRPKQLEQIKEKLSRKRNGKFIIA